MSLKPQGFLYLLAITFFYLTTAFKVLHMTLNNQLFQDSLEYYEHIKTLILKNVPDLHATHFIPELFMLSHSTGLNQDLESLITINRTEMNTASFTVPDEIYFSTIFPLLEKSILNLRKINHIDADIREVMVVAFIEKMRRLTFHVHNLGDSDPLVSILVNSNVTFQEAKILVEVSTSN